MPTIGIHELTPGQTVARDVVTPDGRVLLASGGKIEPWHINLFRGLGLTSVDVTDAAQDDTLEAAAAYAREFFAFVNPDHPALLELFALSAEMLAKRMNEGWRLPSFAERRAENVEHLQDSFPMELVTVDKIVTRETQLASFPDIYLKLRQEMQSPGASMNRLAELISQDMTLTAKILKLANSPLYGFSEPVESIARAVAIIGMQELNTLAMGITAINYFKGIPPELVNMTTFWRHSMSCAILSHVLAKAIGESNLERYFIAGLLHDAGQLILFKDMPYVSSEMLLHARENILPVVEAEQVVFGFTHTDVGQRLLEQWQFPEPLSMLINYHHNPMDAPNPKEAAVIHVANEFACAMDMVAGGMYVLPGFDERAWDLLGIPASSVRLIISEFEVQAEDLFKAFF